ncbi:unnamed protein product [Heligmosomoides polygyrus]|uniref:Uncharacterized protein n=1 Tax=Heligmosomoides polygyrus TaxID=6339 RepID=A0A3P8FEX5_HELPZ|nr:unnamed protein product [Heligmosomoides polygyrus]
MLSSLLIVKGGIHLPRKWALLLLIIFVFLLCQSIVTPPCLFTFRYLQICRTNFLAYNYRRLRLLLIIPVCVSTSCCAMLCFAAWPTETDRILFDKIAFNINVNWNSTYLVASFHKNITEFDKAQGSTLVAVAVYLILVLVVALTLMVFCTTAIVKAVQKSANEKTRRLQIQLYRTLIAQVINCSVILFSPHCQIEEEELLFITGDHVVAVVLPYSLTICLGNIVNRARKLLEKIYSTCGESYQNPAPHVKALSCSTCVGVSSLMIIRAGKGFQLRPSNKMLPYTLV